MINKEKLREAILDGIGRTNCVGAMDEDTVCDAVLKAIPEAGVEESE